MCDIVGVNRKDPMTRHSMTDQGDEIADNIDHLHGAPNPMNAHLIELPPVTCGQTMIGGPCDRPSLHEGPDENPLSRDIDKARRVFNI